VYTFVKARILQRKDSAEDTGGEEGRRNMKNGKIFKEKEEIEKEKRK
jgi:hypothetical protein